MNKGALISEDDKYRYKLWRIWDNKKPIVLYIMLNPSIADDNIDDPTIKTLIRISQNNGFGGFYVGNLSPYRATNPTELNSLTIDELIPVENYSHIEEMIKNTSLHILAHSILALPSIKIKLNLPNLIGFVIYVLNCSYVPQ